MEGSPKRQKPEEEEFILKSVPTSIPRHITSLVLCKCGLTSIPDVLLKCMWLKKINFYGNRLTYLPDAIGNWTSLEQISFSGNQLTYLPKAVGRWTSLEWINLSANQLTYLPKAVGRWTSLKVILLFYIEFIVFPDTVGNWTSIEEIHVSKEEGFKFPKNRKDFKEYYSSRLRLKKEATLLCWVLKKAGLPRDLANLGRKAVWAQRVKIKQI